MDMKSKLLYVRTSRDCRSVSSRLVVVLFKSLASYSKGWGSLDLWKPPFQLAFVQCLLGGGKRFKGGQDEGP